MISLGAAICFIGLPALALGLMIGDATHRRHEDGKNQAPPPTEWGAISRAAADSYRGAHAAAVEAQPDWVPRMILTSNADPMAWLVDGDGFRRLTGVDPETVLRALERAAADPMVWL